MEQIRERSRSSHNHRNKKQRIQQQEAVFELRYVHEIMHIIHEDSLSRIKCFMCAKWAIPVKHAGINTTPRQWILHLHIHRIDSHSHLMMMVKRTIRIHTGCYVVGYIKRSPLSSPTALLMLPPWPMREGPRERSIVARCHAGTWTRATHDVIPNHIIHIRSILSPHSIRSCHARRSPSYRVPYRHHTWLEYLQIYWAW